MERFNTNYFFLLLLLTAKGINGVYKHAALQQSVPINHAVVDKPTQTNCNEELQRKVVE